MHSMTIPICMYCVIKGIFFLYDNLQQKLNKTDFCKRQIWSSQSQQIWIQNMLGMLNPISCITWHVTTQRKTFKLLFISFYYEQNTMCDSCFSWTFHLVYVQLDIIMFSEFEYRDISIMTIDIQYYCFWYSTLLTW